MKENHLASDGKERRRDTACILVESRRNYRRIRARDVYVRDELTQVCHARNTTTTSTFPRHRAPRKKRDAIANKMVSRRATFC